MQKSYISVQDSLPTRSGYYICKLRPVKGVVEKPTAECYFNAPKGYFEVCLPSGTFKTTRVTHWRAQ